MGNDDIEISPFVSKIFIVISLLFIGFIVGCYYTNFTSPYKVPEELPDYIDDLVATFPPMYGNSGFSPDITIEDIKYNYMKHKQLAKPVLVRFIRDICMAGDWTGLDLPLPDMQETYNETCKFYCGCD